MTTQSKEEGGGDVYCEGNQNRKRPKKHAFSFLSLPVRIGGSIRVAVGGLVMDSVLDLELKPY